MLDELVFATYVGGIKEAWKGTIANENLIDLLYGLIVLEFNVTDQKHEPLSVTKEAASRLMHRKDNVSPKIWKHAYDPEIAELGVAYFTGKIVPRLLTAKKRKLLESFVAIVQVDPGIDTTERAELLQHAQESLLADFLFDLYRFVLCRKNKSTSGTTKHITNEVASTHTDGDYKRHPLEAAPTPEQITQSERKYVAALLSAYGQESGVPNFDEDTLQSYPRYDADFKRQRECYFAAEAVRRGTRDVYSPEDPDQFAVLEDEIFDGVVEAWDAPTKNGMTRKEKVMSQVVTTTIDRCWLCRDTDWIGNAQKKGVCHFLVNDDRLPGWVREDDEQHF